MKSLLLKLALLPCLLLPSCDTLQQLANEPTNFEISQGLKQALEFGVREGADFLSKRDGYFLSEYKILLPPEARKVTDKLKFIPGFTNVENIILEKNQPGCRRCSEISYSHFCNSHHRDDV